MQTGMTYDDGGLGKHLQGLSARIDNRVKAGVQAVSREFMREVTGKEGLSKYPRHKRGTPTPSPAGEPPAQVSTMLRKSMQIRPAVRIGFGIYEQTVQNGAVYARIQEFGSSRTPARPFMRPAKNRTMKKADRLFKQAVLLEVKRGK